RICDLLRAAKSTDRHVFQHCAERIGLSGHHPVEHRRMDDTRTNGIDANPPRGIVESRTFRQPQNAMLRGLVRSAPGASYQSSDRRAVDDRAAFLPEHLAQFELHATPYTAQIDG